MITIGNVCFINNEDDKKVLLLKRKKSPLKDLYTGVGGKTNFAEDIRDSCIREVKEETGLDVYQIKLKAVIKTLLEDSDSSWILFVYTAKAAHENTHECNEGVLQWVEKRDIKNYQLIGFIKEIITIVLGDDHFLEGTIHHDANGNVIQKSLHLSQLPQTNEVNW
jgi:8-oxo-dGTP diphosphatase